MLESIRPLHRADLDMELGIKQLSPLTLGFHVIRMPSPRVVCILGFEFDNRDAFSVWCGEGLYGNKPRHLLRQPMHPGGHLLVSLLIIRPQTRAKNGNYHGLCGGSRSQSSIARSRA